MTQNTEQKVRTPEVEAIAYFAELATVIDQDTREYSGWEPRLRREPFCVPVGTIRNETPLVDGRPYLRTIAALEARAKAVEDAAENVLIAFGMGWDMQGVLDVLQKTLKETKPCVK